MKRNTRLAKSAVSALFALQALLAMVFLVSCSDNKVAGGNSSEVGSPELMGTLAFMDGSQVSAKVASYARVYCVPADFDPAKEDSTSYYTTTADSMGHFAFDNLPEGVYNLEAFYEVPDGEVFVLRESGLKIATDQAQSVDLELGQGHDIKIYLQNPKDSVASLSIVGSTYKATAKITTDGNNRYATFTGVPASYYDSVQVSTSEGTNSIKAVLVENTDAKQAFYYDSSARTLEIPLNTSATGIDLRDTIEGFPLYVRLNDLNADDRKSLVKNLYSLKVYLEPASFWTTFKVVCGKDSIPTGLWVRLSTLYPQRETQKLVFAWNAGAAELSDNVAGSSDAGTAGNAQALMRAADPFSFTDGFVAAWNFDESEFPDSSVLTSGDNPFKGRVTDVTAGDGIIGGAFVFNGKSSIIEIQESADYWGFALKDTSSFTSSFWVNVEDTSTSRFIWGKSESEYHFKYQAGDSDRSSWMFKELDESDLDHWYEASIAIAPETDYKQWVHFTVVKSGDSTAIYRNGKLEETLIGRNNTDDKRMSDGPFIIGARKQSSGKVDRVFKGSLDELYFMNKAKGSEWARLIYLNQKPTGYWPK
ncbi:LamG-like jellyroll fold domain-containing protein [Fibrobacter sp. UWB13]|uniref:LamG-like jellyroll fold domain-containing protein n=1 Tax=Fibrobacter sp. UWB13 TaxID=1896204 RepID=UPI000A0E2CED|nr:LamG-like jellyroll fold domain-containing protein [Fibrobacter sp. UWB13]SMG21176.1 Concanavalin A-like lectin/glucanases superfamily protein [Fibrobacter sp. UWB13]